MNWTAITVDDLKTEAYGYLVDRARTAAVGAADPVAEAITNAVNKVRRIIAANNVLDTDPTKVPGSVKDLAMRLAIRALHRRLGLELSEDERTQRGEDNKEMERWERLKVRFEPADSPDTSNVSPYASPGDWNSQPKLIMRTAATPTPGEQYPNAPYANPDGPTDEAGSNAE